MPWNNTSYADASDVADDTSCEAVGKEDPLGGCRHRKRTFFVDAELARYGILARTPRLLSSTMMLLEKENPSGGANIRKGGGGHISDVDDSAGMVSSPIHKLLPLLYTLSSTT
jgi:hypothetical protein